MDQTEVSHRRGQNRSQRAMKSQGTCSICSVVCLSGPLLHPLPPFCFSLLIPDWISLLIQVQVWRGPFRSDVSHYTVIWLKCQARSWMSYPSENASKSSACCINSFNPPIQPIRFIPILEITNLWKSLSGVRLFATPLEFSRPEYWSA